MLPNHSALKVAETFRALQCAASAAHPATRFGPLEAVPTGVPAPQIHLLGASDEEQLRGLTRARSVVGAAESVGRTLRALVDESQADEVMATTTVHHHGERKRSYERLLGALRG
jgi:alkanesulfonate monooxygenase SsuD/methylene tetrahydromethanopterin reductase-like flavin-dependent oxidoreductase (luciferase family)